jgi:hypothetical protein
MFKKLKKKTKNQLELVNNEIKIKNFPANPNKGGIPANDIKLKTMKIE